MKKFYYLILAVGLLFISSNLIIGLYKPLWLDEVASLNLLKVTSWSNLLNNIYNGADTNPPLYFLLLFFVQKLTKSVIYFRLFSVSLSITGLILLLRFLRKFVNKQTTAIVLIIISISYFFPQYLMVEVRPYAMFFLLSVLFLVQYYRISFQNQKNIFNILSLIFITIFLLYTHYFAIFYIIITLIFEIFNKNRKNYLVLISILIGILSFLPWVVAIRNQLSLIHGIVWQAKPKIWEIIKLPSFYFNSFLTIFVLIGSVVGLFIKKIDFTKIHKEYGGFLILIIIFSLFPFINIILTYFNLSVSEPRYYIPSYISYIFILAIILNLFELVEYKLLLIPILIILFIYGSIMEVSYFKFQRSRKEEIKFLLKLNQTSLPILCESPHKFYPLDFYAKENGISNFYFILDKESAVLKSNVKNAIFDYYWNENLKHIYKLNHLIPIEEVINCLNAFYLLNEKDRMIFEHRFENNPSYSVKKEGHGIYFIEKLKY